MEFGYDHTMRRTIQRPSPISVLRSSTLLNAVSDADLDSLVALCHTAYAERGDTLWIHGSQTEFFGIVGVGFVKMVKSLQGGQEVTHEIMGPGQVFGLLGTIDRSGCPLSARAVTPLWYLKVPKREFIPIYERTSLLRDHVVRRTALRLRRAHEMLAQLSTGTVKSRIASILLMLADSYGVEVGEAIVIDVPLTRQDLGEMAGTTVETTIRVMSQWQKQGLVSTASQKISLLDPERLVREITV